MVKIAVAGGSGNLAREIVDTLVATGKHEILILSRKDPAATEEILSGVTWVKADYGDKAQLTKVLKGVHTLFSFITAHQDPGSVAQRLLIDAAIAAGVKRFAPNESSIEELPWYQEKQNLRDHLAEINKDKKVLEYTLFQPGLIIDYALPAGSSTKHIEPFELFIDFVHRRAIILESPDLYFTFTTVPDLANIVARAVECTGEWPVIGGVQGTNLHVSKLFEIGEKARGGKPWDITRLKEKDVRADNIQASWLPKMGDPTIPADQIEIFSKLVLKGSLLSGICGSWVVSDDWNKLLPDYKFENIEDYLQKHWGGRD